ncbi:MAG: penicillin acylase family protein [Streptosporangiaceae bacterium]|nr:penicillin acylase family protein [Streptosporangiaceae bacterium]
MRLRAVGIIAASAALVAVAAPPALASRPAAIRSARPSGERLVAQIRYTTGGIPHIVAHDWASLGFGYGYAFATDNLCTMANDYITVEAQRSAYFGPKATYVQRGNGVIVSNLDSDLFFQQIINSGVVQHLATALSPPERQLESGYVAGYNAYLAHVGGRAGVTDPTCRGKAWVKPITLMDSYLRFYQLMLLGGSDTVISGIAEAAPPAAAPTAAAARAGRAASERQTARELAAAWRAESSSMGSNAVAIGSAGTRDHRGLLLGNPHFPWLGPERFYQAQLTIPGEINVAGASLYGIPLILIGHNQNVAWSHTVSTAFRFTPYQLTLVNGHPTEYLQNGHPVAMSPRKVTIRVKQANGKLATYTRTLWWTRYGPVFNSLSGIPLPWTTSQAFAFADVNAGNLARAVNTWFGIGRASSTQQILAILKRYQGIPWVNTIAADRSGLALYADIGAIPHVTNAEAKACDTSLGAFTFGLFGLPILDGSKTACDWGNDRGAAAPGIFGPSHEPYLLRSDYVTNSNDSYWLSNPHHPLTGFARIIGTERTARTLRTRIGLIQVQARISGTDRQGPPGFTLAAMQRLDLSDDSYAAQLTLPDLVKLCDKFQAAGGFAPTSGGGKVRLGDACPTLARWNGRADPGQRGAVLFSMFWNFASSASPSPFSHPFQLSHPVTTPYGLNTANATVHTALGDAISQLRSAHIPIDTTLAAVQYVTYHGAHIPIPGGPGDPDGIFNAIYVNSEPGDSLTAPDSGSSFIQVVTWPNKSGCPATATILTYSESSNPASPHYADQTRLFSRKQWLPDRFCPAQIAADPNLEVTTVTGGA